MENGQNLHNALVFLGGFYFGKNNAAAAAAGAGATRTDVVFQSAAHNADSAAAKSHHPVPRRFGLGPRVAFPRRPIAANRGGRAGEHDRVAPHGDETRTQARLGRAIA